MGGDYGDHKIVVVERTWNNYDAEAADGLWAMASVLHSMGKSPYTPAERMTATIAF